MMDVIDLTRELVAIPSLHQNPADLKKVLERALAALPATMIRRTYEKNGKPSAVVGFSDTQHPEVLFLAHLDVVDAEPEQFSPRIEGDRLVGRGVLDMKGPAAAVICAFRDVHRAGKSPSAALMLTTDEEVGSGDGVAYLVREQGWSADFVVIPDGGRNFTLVIKGKGAFHFKAEARGKAAHGSNTWKGDNAVDKLLGFYEDLKPLFRVPEPCGDEGHWHETLNLGVIKGGKKVNIVPDRAEAQFDIRFTEAWTLKRVRETVEGLAEKHGLHLEVESTGEPFFTPKDEPHLVGFAHCVERVLGREPVFGHEHGATDGRFFSEKGVPTVIIYPEGGNIHGDDEWVSVSSLGKFYEVMKAYLEEI